jgi:hypothetical protein
MLPTAPIRHTLFVHIGTHKTGTTSIQNFLRIHASRLTECGIFIPTVGTLNRTSGHHNIAWQVRNDRRYVTDLGGVDELVTELRSSQASTAVISSEDFEYLSEYPRELRAFDERLEKAGFATKYLVFFRDVEGYARSLFCELESANGWLDYDVFRKSIQNEGFVRVNGDWHYEFRYDFFVEKWEAILGPKIYKYSYDEAVLGLGLLPSFLMAIGASKAVVDEGLNAPKLNTMFDKYQQMAFQLTTIKHTTSWRLTAPLRNTADYCKRILRRLAIISTSLSAFIGARWLAIVPVSLGLTEPFRRTF